MLHPVHCAQHERRETTLTGSKFLINHHISGVTDRSGLQDKDSGALLFLAALNTGRSGVYEHRNYKHLLVAKLHVQSSPIRNQRLGTFPLCSIIVN